MTQDNGIDKVIQYSDNRQHWKRWMEYKTAIMENDKCLYITIADECHWGPTACQAHDKMVNDYHDNPASTDSELLQRKNHIVLLVSATPYNVLSRNSRIPEEYVITCTPPEHAGQDKFRQLEPQRVLCRIGQG